MKRSLSQSSGGRRGPKTRSGSHEPVTFTTLGYGDIVLPDRWRLLSSFEAANGIIMFGWTTAVVMYVVQRSFSKVPEHIHRKRGPSGT